MSKLGARVARLTQLRRNEQGFLLPALLSFIIAMAIISGAVLEVVLNNFTIVSNNVTSQKAFNIAEAGINYYLWHLSHNASDFKDGKSIPATQTAYGYGPYVHDYVDADAITEGAFTIYVKPQSSGSTIATVRSIGKVNNSNITRTVEAQIGAPSFASYAVVSDQALWFGNTESADGPVHSNQGIRMDGASSGQVSSANTSYVPSSSIGGDGSTSRPGVWCNTNVTSPVNCNTRNKSNWTYPATSVDFNQVSTSLCTMKKVAFANNSSTAALATQTNACSQVPTTRTSAYVPQLSTSFSISKGYLIKLNSNGSYDLYSVNSEDDSKTPYTSALGTTLIATNIAAPSSGVIFVEDNVWVLTPTNYDGRVTVASGRLASSSYNTNIVIAGNIKYAQKDGSDAIGLVAEDSVYVAPYAPPATGSFTYEVDAALLAGSGNVTYGEATNSSGVSVYRTSSSTCTRGWTNTNQTFLFYGSIANRLLWTWSWLQGNGSCTGGVYDTNYGAYLDGFKYNTTQYDYNLQYAPPPSYPITGGYNILAWREVLTKP